MRHLLDPNLRGRRGWRRLPPGYPPPVWRPRVRPRSPGRRRVRVPASRSRGARRRTGERGRRRARRRPRVGRVAPRIRRTATTRRRPGVTARVRTLVDAGSGGRVRPRAPLDPRQWLRRPSGRSSRRVARGSLGGPEWGASWRVSDGVRGTTSGSSPGVTWRPGPGRRATNLPGRNGSWIPGVPRIPRISGARRGPALPALLIPTCFPYITVAQLIAVELLEAGVCPSVWLRSFCIEQFLGPESVLGAGGSLAACTHNDLFNGTSIYPTTTNPTIFFGVSEKSFCTWWSVVIHSHPHGCNRLLITS